MAFKMKGFTMHEGVEHDKTKTQVGLDIPNKTVEINKGDKKRTTYTQIEGGAGKKNVLKKTYKNKKGGTKEKEKFITVKKAQRQTQKAVNQQKRQQERINKKSNI